MSRTILYSFLFLLAFASSYSYAQTESFKGYRIEGDDLVFIFDKRDYKIATADNFSNVFDFDDLDIKRVVVAGEFNNWSKNNWNMTKIDENRYELRKKLSDFTDEFSWEFKFVINNAYWAEPAKEYGNAVRAFKNGHALQAYNLKMYTAYPDEEGNITFTLNGYTEARKVVLSGSFNKWNEELFRMTKSEDCWTITLKIKPGEYEYKFIVDGDWIEDPDNPLKKRNEFNQYNSFIDIKAPKEFILNGNLEAQEVILTGSFNNWSEHESKMTKTKSGWVDTLMLSGGKYHYKYIVDNKWILDPDNTVKEYDAHGNVNSVCIVK
ncbi:glycogen-binding domain-containing protein [Aquimarina mytili]|uniref:Glycogen-binding domain-containing protein n=1 Tax=Aquimarina mytili TaxID=874423 RepID=A0A936ZPT8_9FLAO|nr:glycogen-binding domain-containing protein [Aquimarina mytili]MBL0682087.1 glycogen-binding domain-containing protein [Aquimarina mytili]